MAGFLGAFLLYYAYILTAKLDFKVQNLALISIIGLIAGYFWYYLSSKYLSGEFETQSERSGMLLLSFIISYVTWQVSVGLSLVLITKSDSDQRLIMTLRNLNEKFDLLLESRWTKFVGLLGTLLGITGFFLNVFN